MSLKFCEKLKNQRGGIKGFFAYIILGTIVLVFVFLGVDPTSIGSRQGGIVAVVNKKNISILEHQRILERLREERSKASEKGLSSAEEEKLRIQALDFLVNLELVESEAKRLKVFIPKEEIINAIVSIPYFKEKGVFRREYYLNFLKLRRQTASDFEMSVKKQIMIQKFFKSFQKALHFSELEKERKTQADQVQLDVSFLNFEVSKLKDKASYEKLKQALRDEKDKEIEQFVKENKLSWEETGKFELSALKIPKIPGSENLLETLLKKIKKDKKYLNEPVPFLNRVYVFKIKNFTNESTRLSFLKEFQSFFHLSSVESVFSKWLQSLKKKTSIKYHLNFKKG